MHARSDAGNNVLITHWWVGKHVKCIREMPVHQLLSSQLISTVETLPLVFAFQEHASEISRNFDVTSLITQAACNQSSTVWEPAWTIHLRFLDALSGFLSTVCSIFHSYTATTEGYSSPFCCINSYCILRCLLGASNVLRFQLFSTGQLMVVDTIQVLETSVEKFLYIQLLFLSVFISTN